MEHFYEENNYIFNILFWSQCCCKRYKNLSLPPYVIKNKLGQISGVKK